MPFMLCDYLHNLGNSIRPGDSIRVDRRHDATTHFLMPKRPAKLLKNKKDANLAFRSGSGPSIPRRLSLCYI
jgi:hypothetical protein